ncbi:MAG: D-alanyl-D-alanine carboxypeptidase/D-alanyl-D-alanine-endopeptidase, partial [Phycisphaerae bacterium]|nr:D-alanyl-D-alanine carboxypeptidase/D-alanyl-D-alanine-endopeptidase [Phycisphaerae bacterium]
LDKIFADKALGRTIIAVRVIDVESNNVLYSVRAAEPMIPASVAKLVTTAAAIRTLGDQWKFHTYIGTMGQDLVVIGGGDPNFSGRFYKGDPVGAFRRWARVFRRRKITHIRGRLVLDDSAFEPAGPHPNWPPDQRQLWHEAPAGALCLNDNCIDVTAAPGERAGDAARISISPLTKFFHVSGRVITTANRKEHRYSLERLAGEPAIFVSGKIWLKAQPVSYFRTVADPTAFFGAVLKETFAKEGVRIDGPVARIRLLGETGKPPNSFRPVVVHTSNLMQTVAVTNKRSQGLYAECILKAMAAYATGKEGAEWPQTQGNWNAGRDALEAFSAKERLAVEGCVFDDGSGLSRQNRLTANYVTELLRMMYRRHGLRWRDTLSIAGVDGTLRGRMRGTAAEGQVFAKTGYVRGVSTIAGYARTRSGRVLAFAILMNRTNSLWRARRAQDAACTALAEH